jgi:CubicO group peptidase (beta-lactamase class C family)
VAARTACPVGWHLPSDADWTVLTDYLGSDAGGKMKETGTKHWSGENTGAINSSGFTALPGGARLANGSIIDLGSEASFWSSTGSGISNAWYRGLDNRTGAVSRYNDVSPAGFSVRCLYGAVLPTVTTNVVSSIAEITALSGGVVISDGGAAVTARGVCWNTTGLPVITDSKTSDGIGSGAFTSNIVGLTGKTTFHVRAYAVNSAGTSYGNEQIFTTTGVVQNDIQSLDGKITAFMNLYKITGASLAVSKNGKLVYMKGYGFSDLEKNEWVVPTDRFRLASVSKTYTGVAIMKLIQDGKFSIDDKVFGTGSILGADYGTAPYNGKLTAITVKHLLQHTTGSWGGATGSDVIDQNPAFTDKQLMDWIIDTRPMTYTPGTFFDYSNVNYFILGRIIEKASGQPYFEYLKTILNAVGATDTDIAGKTLADRKVREVKYYGQGTDAQYVYNIAFPRRVADGGIIATAKDLLKLVTAFDGFTTRPDIFNPATLTQFITPSPVFASYACGIGIWSAQHLWFNNGSLPGTRTWFMRDDNGMCVALLLNSRPDLDPNSVFTYAMQDVCLDVVKNANYRWQDIDQF